MIAKTFPRGGGEIPHRKAATESKPIVAMPAPSVVVIPLIQHIGAICEPLVSIGDKVKMGQKIGEGKQYICAPVHSSVSGKVVAIEERPSLNGNKVLSIIIENDEKDEPISGESNKKILKLSPEAMCKTVREAGIVGMGGAGFPTHVKFQPPMPVDTVLINGAECEPYLTCDHRLMVEKAAEMVGGLLAIMRATGAANGIVCIEDNKPDAIAVVTEAIKDHPELSVEALQVRYPQGAEKQLIKAVLDKEVPSGCLPCESGCIVNNVHTAIAVYEALTEGKASYERVVTVSGGSVVDPRNVLVRIGTSIKELLDFCGGLLGEPGVIISGGPMTGQEVTSLEGPVVKALSGILALSKEEAFFDKNLPCIRCTLCVQACPMGLTPNLLGEYSSKGMFKNAEKLNIDDCIECALCSYVCPAKRALITWIIDGKAGLAAERAKEKVS